jgi:hypothetical protein
MDSDPVCHLPHERSRHSFERTSGKAPVDLEVPLDSSGDLRYYGCSGSSCRRQYCWCPVRPHHTREITEGVADTSYSVGAVYFNGRFHMSTWIPFIWGWINVLVLIVSSFTIQGGL